MNPRITAVTARDDHNPAAHLCQREIRHSDITPYLGHPAFEPLRQVAFFKLAKASHGIIT